MRDIDSKTEDLPADCAPATQIPGTSIPSPSGFARCRSMQSRAFWSSELAKTSCRSGAPLVVVLFPFGRNLLTISCRKEYG
jgi:hypothetical protein